MLSQLDFCQKNSILFLTENHFFGGAWTSLDGAGLEEGEVGHLARVKVDWDGFVPDLLGNSPWGEKAVSWTVTPEALQPLARGAKQPRVSSG